MPEARELRDLQTRFFVNVMPSFRNGIISRLLCYHAGEDAEDPVTPLNCIG